MSKVSKVCDNCGVALTPVFPEMAQRYDDDQWEDCLHLSLMGGYGEYIDCMYDVRPWRLCKVCADELMQYPIMKKLQGGLNED